MKTMCELTWQLAKSGGDSHRVESGLGAEICGGLLRGIWMDLQSFDMACQRSVGDELYPVVERRGLT